MIEVKKEGPSVRSSKSSTSKTNTTLDLPMILMLSMPLVILLLFTVTIILVVKRCKENRNHWQHGPLPPQRPLPVPPSSEYPHTAGYRPPYGNTIKALEDAGYGTDPSMHYRPPYGNTIKALEDAGYG